MSRYPERIRADSVLLLRTYNHPAHSVQVTPPQTTTELKAELERLREERLSKRFGTQQFQQISTSTSPTPSGAGVRESSLRATDFNHQPIPPRQDSASPSERWV